MPEKLPNQRHNKDRKHWIFGQDINSILVMQGGIRRLIPWDEFMVEIKKSLNKKEEDGTKIN